MKEYLIFLGDRLGHIETVLASSFADAEFVAMGKWPGVPIGTISIVQSFVSLESE